MTMWGHICRVCSSPADYEIFAKIPTYLHGSTNEFLNWQKPINLLLEETTGLKNWPDDELPRYICAPCISYLKHAVTFREQCMKNALSLKLAQLYERKSVNIEDSDKVDKESALFTAEDLLYVEQRPVHNLLLNNCAKFKHTNKVHKQLLNQTAPQLGNCEQRIRYLNKLFNKHRNAGMRNKKGNADGMELPTTSAGSGSGNGTGEDEDYAANSSSDEENALSRRDKNCYNYSETNFEEDDPMENAGDIKVNIPEPMWKERKCPACSKRFMFEDSFKTHVDNCVEHQFLIFVEEVNKLFDIRRQKMVSPHEFIRRMIFALHKTCTWLQEHSIDTLLAEKLKQVKVASNIGGSEKTADALENVQAAEKPALWSDAELQPFDFTGSALSGTNTPITVENNVLYAIERSESRNSQQGTPAVKKPIPIRGTALHTARQGSDDAIERATFLEKLQRANVTPLDEQLPGTPTNAGTALSFSARCGQCNLVFDSVSELEIHNGMHHNGRTSATHGDGSALNAEEAQRRRIIALFEDDI